MVQLLAHSLARHVVAIDVREDARAAAIANGADEAREPSAALDLADEVEVVIEASGTAPGLDLATKLVRQHGILSILGFHVGERRVDLETWNYKALDVVNAHVRDERLMRAGIETGVRLQAAGRIDAGELITHRFALDQVDDAFSALRDKPVGFVKSVVEWDG
jgi:threonine dehydrogenase-like Zn-dependent dehydrogenase